MSGDANGSLPKGWAECTIGDITVPVSKVDPKENGAKHIAYVDISSIDNARNRIGDTREYVLSEAPSRARQIIHSGDVLFSTVRPYLRNIAAVPEALDGQIGSTGFSVLRPAPGIDPKFLFYKATSPAFVNALSGAQYGVSYPAVRDSQVRDQVVQLPPSAEQRRIVARLDELLSGLDKGVENLQAARAQLEVYRQSLLKEAFEGRLTASWREKDGTSSRKSATQQPGAPEDMPHLPRGWLYHHLGGSLTERPRYGTSKKCSYDFEGTGVIRIPNIANGTIDSSDLKGADFTQNEASKYALQQGDVLVIRSNGSVSLVGKCALISESDEQYLFAGYLIRLRCDTAVLRPQYLALALSSHALRTQIETAAKSTSGVHNINAKELQSLLIPVCSLDEQGAIVERLSSRLSTLDAVAAEIDTEIRRAEMLRNAVLGRAFAGQLVEQDPSDEPAYVLLERISAERETKKGRNKKRKVGA